MIQEQPPIITDDLFANQQYNFDYENQTTVIQLTSAPETLPQFSASLASHATYDQKSNTITYKRSMTPENRDELHQHFPKDHTRIDFAYAESNHNHPERLSRIEMGYKFCIPQLCVQETPDLFQVFNEEVIYERIDYDRRDLTAALLKLDYHSTAGEITTGEISMDQKGVVMSQTLQILQDQSFAWDLNAASNWSEADLVQWLDGRMEHPDIIASDMTAVLSRVIAHLTTEKMMNLQQLVVDKYILLKSFLRALKEFRDQ